MYESKCHYLECRGPYLLPGLRRDHFLHIGRTFANSMALGTFDVNIDRITMHYMDTDKTSMQSSEILQTLCHCTLLHVPRELVIASLLVLCPVVSNKLIFLDNKIKSPHFP